MRALTEEGRNVMKERSMARDEPLKRGKAVEEEEEESESDDKGEERERKKDKNKEREEEESEGKDGESDVEEGRKQRSSRSSDSWRSAANQSRVSDAVMKAKMAENELEALKQVLKGKEAMVKAARDNVALAEEGLSQASGGKKKEKNVGGQVNNRTGEGAKRKDLERKRKKSRRKSRQKSKR